MNPSEFQSRFRAGLASNPRLKNMPDLLQERSEFVSFNDRTLVQGGLHPDDVTFLVSGGLPRQAAPFLSFSAYSASELHELHSLYDMPTFLFPLGANGSGDALGIDVKSREVVYLNHDDHMRRVFVNSSVSQFAHTLCLYQEALIAGITHSVLSQIASIDPFAAAPDAMWYEEIAAELEQ